MGASVDLAREAFDRRAWTEAYDGFRHATVAGGLTAIDLERLAMAAYLVGRDDESAEAWEKAHAAHLGAGDREEAARCAFWNGFGLLLRGEPARSGGWLQRASTIVEQAGRECAAEGYLLVPAALTALGAGDATGAYDLAGRATAVGDRCADRDLWALGRLTCGEACIASGEVARGVALLDEVMVAVTSEEVGPVTAGIVYCAVIEQCVKVCDLRRAGEWTRALSRWCDDQPDLVPYRGQCLVHRSQVLQACGDWSAAESAARSATEWLARPPHPALGVALYQQAELHRLHGELEQAERAYRLAGEHGFDPAPGLALLRLAQGRIRSAVTTISRMIEEQHDDLGRGKMLGACIEILVAADDVDGARGRSAELSAVANELGIALVSAMADQAAAVVLLAEGNAAAALATARRAGSRWDELEMPYEAARSRVLVGLACRSLGDLDGAELELRAARGVFDRLGAKPDADRVSALLGELAAATDLLTERQCEVLRLIAAGRTNRDIAAELVISEHTVARHVQNIFTRLGLSSRAAATAYAYEHDLV